MWKKDERQDESVPQRPATTAPPAPSPGPAPAAPSVSASPRASAEHAIIGRSITIRGDVTGDEDLVIQGRVEGSVDLEQHSVTVGRDGEVIASIVGRVVTIEGRVEGNVSGGEQVTLRTSATVKGDIRAPRVVLENGARFRGLVDMGEGEEGDGAVSARGNARPDSRKAGENGRAKTENGAAAGSGPLPEPGPGASPPNGGGGGAEGAKGSGGGASARARRPGEVEVEATA